MYIFNCENPNLQSRMIGCSPGFIEKNRWPTNTQDLNPVDSHIRGPCWKSTINSSRRPRRLMSWKSVADDLGRAATRTLSSRRWQTSLSAWLHAWLPMVVTSSICSNSVHLQVCIVHPHLSTNNYRLFSEPLTFYQIKQRSKRWKLRIIFSPP